MLILILTTTLFAWAAPASRENSQQVLQSACLHRNEIHDDADQRKLICACVVDNMSNNKKLSDANFAYLAKTWAQNHQKIKPAPSEADILEDYDEDLLEQCTQKVSADRAKRKAGP